VVLALDSFSFSLILFSRNGECPFVENSISELGIDSWQQFNMMTLEFLGYYISRLIGLTGSNRRSEICELYWMRECTVQYSSGTVTIYPRGSHVAVHLLANLPRSWRITTMSNWWQNRISKIRSIRDLLSAFYQGVSVFHLPVLVHIDSDKLNCTCQNSWIFWKTRVISLPLHSIDV